MILANTPSPLVEVFTGSHCSYCHRAKALLERKGVEFSEFNVSHPDYRADMSARLPTARTIPQIFIGGRHIGGFDDLNRLDMLGELDRILGLKAA